jgi:hypothetical protein
MIRHAHTSAERRCAGKWAADLKGEFDWINTSTSPIVERREDPGKRMMNLPRFFGPEAFGSCRNQHWENWLWLGRKKFAKSEECCRVFEANRY